MFSFIRNIIFGSSMKSA